MIPHFIPTQAFSARWALSAIGFGSQARALLAARARAAASSTAAEEESPAPMGTSPASTPSNPRREWPSSRSDQATPFTYSAQAGPVRESPSRSNSVAWSNWREKRRTRPSGRGRNAIQAARSMAMGSTKPSL